MSRGWIAVAVLAALSGGGLSGCGKGSDSPPDNASGAAVDLSGVWLPDASRAEGWPSQLPLTAAARTLMDNFNPAEHDPTTFCMPMGTPRNMLQTEYPLEIAQTPQRVVMVVQPNLANSEVRRIPLDGGAMPESPDPSWFGTSRGRWEGATLVVETIGLRPDALVSGNGLQHSEDLRVVERLSVIEDAEHGTVLVDEIELHDPKAFQAPLKTRRHFVRAPNAQLREPTSCIELEWIEKLWRQRLEEHAAVPSRPAREGSR
jgi:hypothetical protein